MEKKDIIEALQKKFPDAVLEVSSLFGDEIISFKKETLLEIARFLKGKPYDYAMLLDETCVDLKGESPRFEMVYHFLSLTLNDRIRLKTRVSESDARIESLTPLWKNANWLEREIYDMFGIEFDHHPYLRRLFMWDGFDGYPLRKDYPLRMRQIHPRLSK